MGDEVRFDGGVVIVTGGAGGIGRSQAVEIARRGARVVVNDLGGSPRGGGADPSMAQAVVDEIVASGVKRWPAARVFRPRKVRNRLSTPPCRCGAALTD